MSTPNWAELDRRQRRHEFVTTTLTIALVWVFLFGIYYLVPFNDRTSGRSLLRLVLAMALFTAVLAWQMRRVMSAELPGLRAVQALGGAIPLFLVVFASGYHSLAQASTTNFSEPLDHTGALYLTITVFSTVGFGDITPEDNVARIAVSIQMLLDLVLIGALVRLLSTAAKGGVKSTGSGES